VFDECRWKEVFTSVIDEENSPLGEASHYIKLVEVIEAERLNPCPTYCKYIIRLPHTGH
jgi:hypothetical protein